jgi:hypothetical protein
MTDWSRRDVIDKLEQLGLEVTTDKIGYLLKEGIIEADIDSQGRGTVKRYGPDNLIDFALALRLEKNGLRTKAIKTVMDKIRAVDRKRQYRDAKNYFLNLVIENPNTDSIKVHFVKSLKRKGVSTFPFDPQSADFFIVVNLDRLVLKVDNPVGAA